MNMQLSSFRRYVAQRPVLPAPEWRLPVLVVGSGKGGVGTSSLAALLALAAAREERRVLLVDADGVLGSQHLLFGVGAGPGFGALAGGEVEAEQLLVPLADNLTLLPGGGDPLGNAERQALFRRVAALYPAYDLVVVDGGSRLDSVRAACAAGAARLVAVSTGDRISLAATYALVKAVGERFPTLAVDLLFNRATADEAESAWTEIQGATRHFLQRSVSLAGAVPDDRCLQAGILAGMSLPDAAAGSPAAASLEQITLNALHQLAPAAPAYLERHPHRRS